MGLPNNYDQVYRDIPLKQEFLTMNPNPPMISTPELDPTMFVQPSPTNQMNCFYNTVSVPLCISPASPSRNMQSPSMRTSRLHPRVSEQLSPLGDRKLVNYAPESSMSGGSLNNNSTAESSLPTQSCSGWNSKLKPQGMVVNDRPSISGSSEAGVMLMGSDFEKRRANLPLTPSQTVKIQFPEPPTSASPEPVGLASFRSAGEQDSCSLVTPYAQLQLSLSLDQYDTPEEIFRGADSEFQSDSNCSYAQNLSSNPTTNSSLLHSYCEHGGGDFRS